MTVPTVPAQRALPASVAEDLEALAAALERAPPGPDGAPALADWLYQNWYLNVQPAQPRSGPPAAAELDLVSALEAAHAGSLRFEPGWHADRVSSTGRVEAVRGRRRRVVGPGQYVDVDRPGAQPEPGDALRVVTGLSSLEGGFWITRTWSFLEGGEQPMTRLYVNVRLSGAPAAVALLTARLLDAGLPFALKVCLQLQNVQRSDALVVYLPRDQFAALRTALAEGVAELEEAGCLVPQVPRLTARLRPGVAAADGEGAGASYGHTRCVILAAGLLGDADATLRERALSALTSAGLDPASPYLSPGSTHDYVPFA